MNSNADLAGHNHRSPWQDLPPELLELIANLVQDLQILRLVCKSWLLSIANKHNPSLHMKLPQKLPPIITWGNVAFNQSIVSTAVYILRRPIDGGRWLVGVQELSPGKLRLVHPLTNHKLPRYLPRTLRKFVPLRITTGITVSYTDTTTLGYLCGKSVKSIYWENPKASNTAHDFVVTLTQCGIVSLLSLGDNNKPRTLSYGRQKKFSDITAWKNRIWAVDHCGRVYGIDFETTSVATVLAASTNMKDSYERQKRLFESNGELYLVVKKERVHDIQVWVLNPLRNVWEKLTSLSDRVLFISYHSCFFAKANDLVSGSFCGNCIVFPSSCFSFAHGERLLFNEAAPTVYLQLVVYDYAKSSSNNMRPVSSDSALSAVFWPPPRWVFEDPDHPDASTSGNRVEPDKAKELNDVTECSFPTSKKRRTMQLNGLRKQE